MIGTRRKKDTESTSKDPAAVNQPVLVGFRAVYVSTCRRPKAQSFPRSPSAPRETLESTGNGLSTSPSPQGIELEFRESIAPALGVSYGGRIAILPGQEPAEEFSTLVHELAHEMLHKAERRTATTKIVRETEAVVDNPDAEPVMPCEAAKPAIIVFLLFQSGCRSIVTASTSSGLDSLNTWRMPSRSNPRRETAHLLRLVANDVWPELPVRAKHIAILAEALRKIEDDGLSKR